MLLINYLFEKVEFSAGQVQNFFEALSIFSKNECCLIFHHSKMCCENRMFAGNRTLGRSMMSDGTQSHEVLRNSADFSKKLFSVRSGNKPAMMRSS